MNSDPSLSSDSPATNASESPIDAPPLTECHWVTSPIGDGCVRATPSPCTELAASLSPCHSTSSSETLEAQTADGDHLIRKSSPLIHTMTTFPVPKEGWIKKENTPDDTGELPAESHTESQLTSEESPFIDYMVTLDSSLGGGNEANNNSSAPIDETIKYQQISPAYIAEDNLSSSSGEYVIEDRPLSPWYSWLLVPEHLVLLSCLVASIGVGALLSSRNKS